MTYKELKRYNGRNGEKAYVAFRGKVYDVTESSFWKEGQHEEMHSAGEDLTEMMADAPHGDEVFEQMPVVATLQEEPAQERSEVKEKPRSNHNTDTVASKAELQHWYKIYHPHPMTIHFPIALHLFAAGIDLLFFYSPSDAYAKAVFYALLVSTIMGFVAMIPGIFSWWVNYSFSMRRPFVVKLVVSLLTLLLGIIGIILYLEDPGIVYEASLEGITYHAIVLFTGMSVIALAYYGGQIVWGDLSKYAAPKASVEEAELSAETGTVLPEAGEHEAVFTAMPTADPVQQVRREEQRTDLPGAMSVSMLIGGPAGSGIDTLEKILSDAFRRSGYYLFSTKEYMSRVRGGSNTTLIRIGDAPLEAPCREVDLFIAIDEPALEHARWRCGEKTMILVNGAAEEKKEGMTVVPIAAEAQKLGSAHYANTYAAGIVFGVLGIDVQYLLASVAEHFEGDSANETAVKKGFVTGGGVESSVLPVLPEPKLEAVEKMHLMDGTTASGFGFLGGGCDFVASYPMSPSTGVLDFMASMSKQFSIAVEQSEDEIASLHMVLGAWYAGARALTTTSGGGFALMGEALSLSGMSETPAVIYLAQRPGPATGMPTRSEQGDLNLAMHSGHGAFQRIILAPGSLQECIDYGYLAFELADRYQLPVILLSDQYLANSMTMIGDVVFSSYAQRRYIVQTDAAYRRYEDAKEGISPRGVPGFGDGLVCADGHEHDERGQITEDHRKRVQMVSKRARKEAGIVAEAVAPERYGKGSIAVVGWGSSRGAIAEALQRLDDARLVQVHFAWVHPLNPDHLEFLKDYSHLIVVENNADGAFAGLLARHGITVGSTLLQYDGFAFFADALAERLGEHVKELS